MEADLLPRPANKFVDREAEISAIENLFLDDERLVTLVGAAGIGKTRLAIELLHHVSRAGAIRIDDRGGAYICDVSDAVDAVGLCEHVARALDAPLAGATGRDAVEHVAALLRARGPVLLALDGFEQLVATAAEVVGGWLRGAPEARFIVTSRSRLGLQDEAVLEIRPLAHAPAAAPPSAQPTPAEQLFIDRVRRVTGGATRPEDHAHARTVVAALDGLPLAIELVASWARTMPLGEIARRLTQGESALDAGTPGRAGRHATLRAALTRSWELLEPHERTVFAQCSVFADAFDLGAAEAVLDSSAHPGARVVDALHALRDKSLLVARSDVRLAMYRAVRELAAERLAASGEAGAAEERHARYFLSWAEERIPRLDGPHARRAIEDLTQGLDDLTAACERASARASETRDPTDTDRACRLALAMATVLARVGSSAARLSHLDKVLAALEPAGPSSELRARLLFERASAHRYAGAIVPARADLERARELAGDGAPAPLRAAIRSALGRTFMYDGAYERAIEQSLEAVRIARDADARQELGRALCAAAGVYIYFGRNDDALPLLEEALAVQRSEQLLADEMATLNMFGAVFSVSGDYARTRTCVARQLELHEVLGDPVLEASAYSQEAFAAHAVGLLEDAERLAAIASEKLERIGNARGQSLMAMVRSCIALERSDGPRARTQIEIAARTARGSSGEECAALFHRAALDAELGHAHEARATLASARAIAKDREDREGFDAHTSIVEGLLELFDASAATGRGDTDAAQALIASARARAEASRAGPARRWLHVRMATRVLEASIARELARPGRKARSIAPVDGSLRVHVEGAWFVPPGGERVEVRGRAPARRVLQALLEARLSQPGQAVKSRDLVAAAWPGEELAASLARNRLHVALHTLRQAGLGPWLETVQRGYRLTPAVTVRSVEDSPDD